MTVPIRYPRATREQEAERLAAIVAGRDWAPTGAVRVRRTDGQMGWRKGGEIYSDSEPSLTLLSYWQTNSQALQEDFGAPAAGWGTAFGYWLPVEED